MSVKKYPSTMDEIANLVKFHRKQARLSRVALADLAEVGKTVIYDIEHGKEAVKFCTLIKVLNVLNISLHFESPLLTQIKDKQNA